MEPFVHLHVHTQYSLLDGQASIGALIEKAQTDGMKAIAITDHGNMFGIKEFFNKVRKKNSKHTGIIKDCEEELQQLSNKENTTPEEDGRIEKLSQKIQEEKAQLFKPIIGCECYCARNGRFSKKEKDDKSGWHLVVLAKTLKGYRNLIKMVSLAWTEGFYSRPRIDKELLEKYHEGLIVSSACLAGEVQRHIQNGQIDKAEESVLWFKNLFGDDYYLEMQRHKTNDPNADTSIYPKQMEVNEVLVELARKHGIKLIATNDVHFVNEDDAEAHDRLICLSTGKDLDDPKRMRYSKQEWMKTTAEMNGLFSDIPEALRNTLEIADKVEFYDIDSPALMPFFEIDEAFGSEDGYRGKFTPKDLMAEFNEYDEGGKLLKDNYIRLGGYEKVIRIKFEADYLEHLTYERAKSARRYGGDISEEVRERIDFELATIKKMGFPGYFLIVQDFIMAARNMGVSVGPGRGSAAGSVVAYCLGITDIDPIKYDLLFERFLNPDRISMPDIDIDFDDDGRGEVLKWVTEKYGRERVAHIITYTKMAAKSSIKDVARVEKLPLSEAERLAKLVPDRDFEVKGQQYEVNLANCLKYVPGMIEASESNDPLVRDTIKYACKLEGNVRNTGVHACGVIIGRQDISDVVPVATADDKDTKEKLLVTQYEGRVIEETGLIKMDFLGLKTLSIIREALDNIKAAKGVAIDIDTIPIDDAETYRLFCEGKTLCTFQFESSGMQKYLKELQPSKFEDLIAMNALYRPGPMDYIPSFIKRKHGQEEIKYDIPVMERYLKDTYGITVYQEQVMLLSRLLAGFTRGESDTLRKAMGKKLKDKMIQLKEKFLAGGEKNGHDKKTLEKIWGDWEKFASYAFNKSHATCYSWVAYQTVYLKAHYPSEFMAAVLSRNLSNIKEISKTMDECKAMGIQVLGPDVNESYLKFGVNRNGDLRFGLAAVKGVGDNVVRCILAEREKNGPFKDIYDFVERVSPAACNKKVMESLSLSGAFDNLGVSRESLVSQNEKGELFIEVLSRYGIRYQNDKLSNTMSLFGDSEDFRMVKPSIPKSRLWSDLERLNKEKDLIGMYLSAHPLDEYRVIFEEIFNFNMKELVEKDWNSKANRPLLFGGIVTGYREGMTKSNKPFAIITIEDFSGTGEIPLFGSDFLKFRQYGVLGVSLLVRASVEMRRRQGQEELGLNIKSISLLQDEKDNLLEKLSLSFSINDLGEGMLDQILLLVEKHMGTTKLVLEVTDEEKNVALNLVSNGKGVAVSQQLLDDLKEIENISYKIN